MADGDKYSRRTVRYDSREPARLSKQPDPGEAGSDDDDIVVPGAPMAPSTPKAPGLPKLSGTPKASATPLMPRTTTLDDPLTTSLLAEVTRRSRTIEVSSEQVDEAMTSDPADPDPSDDPT